jgi:hypothetical protein
MHAPPLHDWPAAQGAPVDPHSHSPAGVHAFDTVVSHGEHAPPGAKPHTGNPIGVHALDRQQPEAHPTASHVHAMLVHSRPAVHAEPPPQVQTPDGHPSPVNPQPAQTAPPVPQVVRFVCATQVPPAPVVVQHPAHELPLQTHVPWMHCCPEGQGLPVPHCQTPDAHVSVVAGQSRQAPPAVPHWVTLAVTHVAPVQQPSGHVSARQAGQVPPLHEPGTQLSHCDPPAPQRLSWFPGSHVAPLQQPAHVELSHTHTPPEQCCPSPQASPLPHKHAPAFVQVSAVMPQDSHFDPPAPQLPEVTEVTQVVPEQHPVHELESQTQAPLLQICPLLHCAFVPQRHVPAEQLSADAGSQSTQVLAPVPHVENDEALHVEPAQHPFGHDAELQTQAPPEQTCPDAHAGADPHRQAPADEQPSALVVSHAVQAWPPFPHIARVDVSQLGPSQHPWGQFPAVQPVHTPPAQFWLAGHGSHSDPFAPHAVVVLPGRH